MKCLQKIDYLNLNVNSWFTITKQLYVTTLLTLLLTLLKPGLWSELFYVFVIVFAFLFCFIFSIFHGGGGGLSVKFSCRLTEKAMFINFTKLIVNNEFAENDISLAMF